MITLKQPRFGVDEVLLHLGSGTRIDRVSRLASEVQDAERTFLGLASAPRWHEMDATPPSITAALAEDLRYAYKTKLGTKTGPARLLYNAIRALHVKCPLCMHRTVAALDHFLPKETWPALSFVPANLYPICTACNDWKRSQFATEPDEQFLHPYFDDLGAENWLTADLIEEPGAPLIFRIERPAGWDDQLAARVQLHHERLHLFELFADESVDLLSSHNDQFLNLTRTAGPLALRGLLFEMASSFDAGNIRRWPGRAFRAWAASDWFCEGNWRT